MAVINRIRKYSWVAVALIGFSIAAFVLADLLGSKGLGFWGTTDRTVGVIRGDKISYEEFESEYNILRNNYQTQTGTSPDEATSAQLREQAWNNFIFSKSFTREFEELGITVTDKELTQMVQGDSIFIHPWVRQQFTNRQTNQFDKQMLITTLQQLNTAPANSPYRLNWRNFENELKKNRSLTKYEDLFKLSSYITKAEAERIYTDQNTKAEVKFLYVPFSSIADSTIKATDEELNAYLSKNREKYKSDETRTIEYVVFDVKPSKEDSTELAKEIKQLARDFATATNDSVFAQINSEKPNPFMFQSLDQIPAVLFNNNPTILKGGIYGPYLDGKSFKIFKASDVKEDSIYYVKASHILFPADKDANEEIRAKAEKQALEVLQMVKDGADFATTARKYGSPTDGATAQGGDLGWFSKGKMVKPFEDAVFAAAEREGLLPNLVKTDFGYHIIKVTHPKTNKKYKLAIIDKVLEPSDKTKNEVLIKVEELKAISKTADDLRTNIKKKPDLVLMKMEKAQTTATNLGPYNNAREVIRWAFNSTKNNEVSDVFDLQQENKYVLATVIGRTTKDASNLEDFKQDITREVIKQKKAEQIIKKLGSQGKSLEDMAKAYGPAALINTINDLSLNAGTFQNTGSNPLAIGKALGMAKGKRSTPFSDEEGVFVLELVKVTPAATIADFSQYKNQNLEMMKQRASYMLTEALKEASSIKDNRYKFY
jgi:peptidyl-prolyl cis-trans isomerase D